MNLSINFLKLAVLSSFLCTAVVANADAMDDAGANVSKAVSNVGDGISNVASQVGETTSDAAITVRVKSLYAMESDIKSFDLSVTTVKNVVDVSGTVQTQLQADRVIELAQSVDGVKDVNSSNLKIENSTSYPKDAITTAKAKGTILRLSNSKIINSKYDLHVETTNGVVHIAGTVANKDDIEKITKAVKQLDGVSSVKTNIKVK